MNYEIIISSNAKRDIREIFQWWEEHRSARQAAKWYQTCLRSIESLTQRPERCAKSLEHREFTDTIRDRYFGLGSRPTHRVVFKIKGFRVIVLAVRHHAMRPLLPEDIDPASE